MAIISIAMQKGGFGKSATAQTLESALASGARKYC